MSFADKLRGIINVSDDNFTDSDENYEDDFDFRPGQDPQPTPQPAPKMQPFHSRNEKNNVVSINTPKATAAKPGVVFQKIDSFSEVNKVADILKEKRIVCLNLESCPNNEAQRIIDVLYGVSYANNGDFKKIAGRAYVITPNDVSVTGELGDEMLGASTEETEF